MVGSTVGLDHGKSMVSNNLARASRWGKVAREKGEVASQTQLLMHPRPLSLVIRRSII